MAASIIAEVTDFKFGPKYARSFNGKFDAETKTWTIPVSQTGSAVSNKATSAAVTKLIDGTFGNGLRVIAIDLEIGEWIKDN